MDYEGVTEELSLIAKLLMATEFDTKGQLQKYLKDHPDANKSNHSVKKQTKKKTNTKKKIIEKVKGKAGKEKYISGLKKREKKKSKGWSTNPNWESADVYEVELKGEKLDGSISGYQKVLGYLTRNDKGKVPTNGTEYVKGGQGMWKENKLEFHDGKWNVITRSGYSGG